MLRRYAFVLCPEGGGLDPSPKAWEALLAGCVPIVRRTATTEGYSDLPVLYIDHWSPGALSLNVLRDAECDLKRKFMDRKSLLAQLAVQHYL
jgi:hypothetical protein